jgi:peptidoglycan/LPS O-acetylase OafA/YrhL
VPEIRLKFLDGIRGWGAAVVLFYHVFVGGIPPFPEYNRAIMRVAFFNGDLAIWIFFLVSGFSLSASFVRFRDRRTLAAMASRRYLRLGIPILFYSLLVYAACKLSLIPGAEDRPGRFQLFLVNSPSLLETLRFAGFDVFFRYSASSTLIPPLWTMPYEMMGSFLVLGALALTPRSLARFWIYVPLAVLAYAVHPLYAAFIVGAVAAEIFISGDLAKAKALLARSSAFLVLAGCIFALALPDLARGSYFAVSTCIFAGCAFGDRLRSFLQNAVSRFLGRISFSLYLVHAPVLWILSLRLAHWTNGRGLGAPGLLGAALVTIVTALLAARALVSVDEFGISTSRHFGRWLTGR